jgi:hypothetical protein
VQNSTCIIDVLSQKSSSLSVPRHMASLVIIENLKNSLVASIHKYRKHNNGKGNITLDKTLEFILTLQVKSHDPIGGYSIYGTHLNKILLILQAPSSSHQTLVVASNFKYFLL